MCLAARAERENRAQDIEEIAKSGVGPGSEGTTRSVRGEASKPRVQPWSHLPRGEPTVVERGGKVAARYCRIDRLVGH
jgi:hypothetical protein